MPFSTQQNSSLRFALLLVIVAVVLGGCSPGYVVRAGWEEAGILWRKRPISEVIKDPTVDSETRRKLELVLSARAFAKKIGLTPDGSYTEYTRVERDVLVYVLTAAPKTKLEPHTWWFPVVGRIPYKGFFELDDAKSEGEALAQRGLDVSVRGAPAFSTLGWFDDPLLSTVVRSDEVALVDTVIHEILHQTLWVNDHVALNESLANFVGSRGSAEFFRSRGESISQLALADQRWEEELALSKAVGELSRKLEELYQSERSEQEKLSERARLYDEASQQWHAQRTAGSSYGKVFERPNNASLLGLRTYLTELELFQKLYERSGNSLETFVPMVKKILDERGDQDPFEALRDFLAHSGV